MTLPTIFFALSQTMQMFVINPLLILLNTEVIMKDLHIRHLTGKTNIQLSNMQQVIPSFTITQIVNL